MSVTTSYPGVYITEIPSGSRTVTGVATSITAFVGSALRGPVDDPVAIASFADFERTFGGLWRTSGLGYAVRDFYTNGGGAALIVRIAHVVADAPDDPDGAASATIDAGGLELIASGPGTWADVLEVDVTHPAADDDPDAVEVATAQGVTVGDLFHLVVREGSGAEAPTETYLNVTVVDGPRRVDVVLAASPRVRAVGSFPHEDGRPTAGTKTVTADGTPGRDGLAPVGADYLGSQPDKTGIYALLKADLFNLLCIPPPTPTGELDDHVWVDAAKLCFDQRAFLIVDPPPDMGDLAIDEWVINPGLLTGTTMRNAAVYFPRIRRPDPLRGGASGDFAPCGAIAGIYARTDATRGVWKAPAGIEAGLTGVSGLTQTLTDAENGALNPLGINVLRTFRGIGSVVWGARTRRGADLLADDYKYIPVRRLALFIEETLYRNTQWVVFEPNDEPLWSQIRASLNAFMQDLFRRGAFQGSTPRDAYFVRCDADTTTQYDIDRGIVNILVGFAPLKPAEFVVISLQQKTASASA
jgi:phage tail sheath protein FI